MAGHLLQFGDGAVSTIIKIFHSGKIITSYLVPDLVFSEMEFLQHPVRHQNVKSTSSIREKDRRKAFTVQDEISMFFKPTKVPLAEKSPNIGRETSSTYLNDEQTMYIRQGVTDRNKYHSQSIELSKLPYSAAPGLSSDRISARGRTPSTHRLRAVPDTSRLSENTASAVTWSATQISPEAMTASSRWYPDNQHLGNSTPEPIRKSIDSTGIFRDTGIERPSTLVSLRAKPSPTPQDSLLQKQHLSCTQDSLKYPDQIMKSRASQPRRISNDPEPRSKEQRSRAEDQTPRQSQNLGIHDIASAKTISRQRSQSRSVDSQSPATTQHSRVVVEHYDLSLGWQRQEVLGPSEKTTTLLPMGAEKIRETQSAPISREQIAKDARIKRSASTIMVKPVPEAPRLQDGSKIVTDEHALSEDVIENRELVNPARERILHSASVSTMPSPAADEAACSQHSLDKAQVMSHGNDDQKSYDIESGGHSRPLLLPQRPDRLSGEAVANLRSRCGISTLDPEVLEIGLIAGIPVRGSLGSFGPPPRTLHLPTEFQSAPLYLDQIRRQFTSELPLPANAHTQFRHEPFNPELVSYLKDNEYDKLDELGYEARGYDGYPTYEKEFEAYTEHDVNEPQQWQPTVQGDDTLEHHEISEGQEPEMTSNYELYDVSFGQAFEATYELKEQGSVHDYRLAEGSIAGFWRPNRPF